MTDSRTLLAEWAVDSLTCPICRGKLDLDDNTIRCAEQACGAVFPIVNGIPVLINEQASVCSIEDFQAERETFFAETPKGKIVKALKRLAPTTGANIKGKANYRRLADLLIADSKAPRVLVIGGSILGDGMEALLAYPEIELVDSDVSHGPRTKLICDAHDIPFADETFDGVIVQAVLEHVADPYRCADEIYRVLKKGGLVYSETAFMQPVHGGRYDFTRFTHLGHLRLFRRFDEIDSGAVCGPGMAVASAWRWFLWSFTTRRISRRIARGIGVFSAFGWKYFDYYLIDKPGALDGAAGTYMLGRKSQHCLTDREILGRYKGAF